MGHSRCSLTLIKRARCGLEQGRANVTNASRSKKKFISPPSVTLNISLGDVHSETNFRMKLQAIDITESGFTASFETWDDTRIARMHVTWQAIGEAIDPDEIWDV